MSENDSNKCTQFEAEDLKTAHISSTHPDEVIMIGADLVPDDIDMFPRQLGTSEAPFRCLFAESTYTNLEALSENSVIGANYPFRNINTKCVNGVPFPGLSAGYGWMYCSVMNTPNGAQIKIKRTSYNEDCYEIKTNQGVSSIILHPIKPFQPFPIGFFILAELNRIDVVNNGEDIQPVTTFRRLTAAVNTRLKTGQIAIDLPLPANQSIQFELLIRLY